MLAGLFDVGDGSTVWWVRSGSMEGIKTSSPGPAYNASFRNVPFGQGALCSALKGRVPHAVDQDVLACFLIALEHLCRVLVGEQGRIVIDLVLQLTK